MLFVCPSAHHSLSTSRWEQTNKEMERQEDRHFFKSLSLEKYRFYNHANDNDDDNVNNHHHRRRFASWFLRRSVVAVRSGRDVILRKRSVFVSIAPVPSLCYQFSCTVSYSSWSEKDSSIPRQIYSHHKLILSSVNIAIVWQVRRLKDTQLEALMLQHNEVTPSFSKLTKSTLFEPGDQGDPSPGEPGQLQGCGRVPGLRSAGG